MKKALLVLISFLIFIPQSFGAFSKADAGTTTAAFLKLGAGSRAAAMADAFTAVADDSNAIYWNPAGISGILGTSISLTHTIWFQDITYDWISYATQTKLGTIGAAVQYLSYGSIKKTDAAGVIISNFTPNDVAAILSYGRNIRGVLFGANLKYISSSIENSATAAAIDLGSKIFLDQEENLALGFCVQNMGTSMKFENTSEPLPLAVKTGVAFRASEEWLLALDVNAPIDNQPNFCVGGEYAVEIKQGSRAAVRAGYNPRTSDIPGFTNFTFGVGLDYSGYEFDYAFLPLGELGSGHKLSFSLKFGKTREDYQDEILLKEEKRPVVERNSLVITELKGEGVTPQLVKFASYALRSEIEKSRSFTVIDRENTDQLVKEESARLEDLSEEQKAVQYGRMLKSRYALIGKIEDRDGYYILTVKLVDAQSSRISKTLYESAVSVEDIKSCCEKIAGRLR